MLKIIVFIAVLAILFMWIKTSRKSSSTDKTKDNNEMINCAKCDTYIEMKDAIMSNGKYVCPDDCK